ncbi:MAG: FG-GAP-like repeat-containing protein [Gemmatimonadetes bacterium]|nr:FG-GAP-like repeat-containing protein [Gemmatimonadota bacterium]
MRYIYIFFFSILISEAGVFAQTRGAIITIAGGGSEDGDNGLATDVALNRPLGIALDTQGNLYIADTDNHRIRRVDAITGIITTVAGTGKPGFSGDGGPATSALLNTPNAIAVDSAGNIYVSSGGASESDVRNRRIRRIDASGIITTVAGTGEGGFNDQVVPALQATFHEIVALTMLGDIALLISDSLDENGQGNNRVRQFDLANNTIGTIAGNGSAQASNIQDRGLATRAGLTPGQLAVTGQGDLLIADFTNGRIRRVSRAMQDTTVVALINTIAGREATSAEDLSEDLYKGDGGPATRALFFFPLGVAVDESGNIYIGDTGNNRIRVVEAKTGNVLTIAGTGIVGAGAEGTLGLLSDLGQPTHLLIDGNGDLIFIDAFNNRIRKLRDPAFRMPLFNAISTDIDFGRVSVGDPAVSSLSVENRGNLSVSVETAISDNPGFRVLSELPLEVGVAQIAEIEIAFDPVQTGIAEGVITITTNDPRTPSAAVNVQGWGEAANIGLFPSDVLIFDRTSIGQSQTSSVRISNLGVGVLVVSNATVTDSQFVVDQSDVLRIESGQSQRLPIIFRPQSEDLQQAVLTIFSNAPGTPAVRLQLQGIGQRAQPGGFVDVSPHMGLGDSGAGFGAAWADFDSDNDLDLYLVRSREPNRLYRNDGAGFTDIGPALGIDDSGDGSAGIWGDVDGDGDLDLYVTNFGESNRLYRNDGARFTDIAATFGVDDSGDGYGAAWADYDRDGDLDLYVANFGANRFYQNNGNGFSERADSLGIGDIESGIQPAWGDFDNDGDPDLFLANSGPNRLFRNDGEQFTSVENIFSPVDTGPSFGATWGDFDNDGDLDLFIPYFGADNRFYTNEGNGVFRDRAPEMMLNHDGRGRGAVWGDFDSDGFLDLYVTSSDQPNLYYKNEDGRFVEMSDSLGVALNANSRGVALADYDNDGKLDLYVAVQDGPDALFRNREADGNWIAFRLRGTDSSTDAIGTRLKIEFKDGDGNNRHAIREITGGASFLSQDALLPAFGVGKAENIEVLSLRWPSGIVQQFRSDTDNLSVNRVIDIIEQPPLPPARVLLSADATNLLANGISEIELTAQIAAMDNRPLPSSDRAVKFRIESGSGLIISSQRSEPAGGDSVAVRDGVAYARFRAGRNYGRVAIVAESAGLESGWVEIELLKPFGEDALTIRTVAGSDNESDAFQGDGGAAIEARLQRPQGVLVDSLGNIYIADTENHRIRLVSVETGVIQTILGIGGVGDIDTPRGMVFRSDLFISQMGGHVVSKVQNDVLSAFAGMGIGQFGGDGARALDANLRSPAGLAVDQRGNIYIADTDNHRIRKVDSNGIITTVVGSGDPDQGAFGGDGGRATQARLNRPSAIAIESQGNIYIADTDNHRIRKVDSNGIITTIAGMGQKGFAGDGGEGTQAQLNSPKGIAVDTRGYLFIADTNNHRVRLLDLNSGLIQTVAGTGMGQLDFEEGGALSVSLNAPHGLALSPTGTVLIADAANHRIRELSVLFDMAFASPSVPQAKSFDFNADGRFDFNDFRIFVSAFDTADTRFDLTADGRVDFGDFLHFARVYEVSSEK